MSYASAGFRIKSRRGLVLIIVNALWRSSHSGVKGREGALTPPLFRIFLLGRLWAQIGVALIWQVHQIHRIREHELGLFNQGSRLALLSRRPRTLVGAGTGRSAALSPPFPRSGCSQVAALIAQSAHPFVSGPVALPRQVERTWRCAPRISNCPDFRRVFV